MMVTVTVEIDCALTVPLQVEPAGQQPTTFEVLIYWQVWSVGQHLHQSAIVLVRSTLLKG